MMQWRTPNPWAARRVRRPVRRRFVLLVAAAALTSLAIWGGVAVGGGKGEDSEPVTANPVADRGAVAASASREPARAGNPASAGVVATETEQAHGAGMNPPLRPRFPEPARSSLLAERMPARNPPPEEPPPKIRTYRVQPGDTLSEIAARFGVRSETILWANTLSSPDRLQVGQELRVPARDGVLHRVAEGDTMWDLARRYGVSTNDIVEANPDVEPGAVGVGEWLLIPGARPLPPPGPQAPATPRPARAPRPGGSQPGPGEPAGSTAPQAQGQDAAGKFGLWPLRGRITSGFGWRINPVTRRRSFHDGVDIAVPVGTPVRAVAAGTVVYSGWLGGWGRTVKIDHGNGIVTRYSHLQAILVQPGVRVDAGQEIALSGSTGVSTGPHLDFGVYRGEEPLNPFAWLP
ncbi:M23 family metallopeptidase [Caldinitratiruptor microaerophilus]|uniref:LysM domain-containing protein n=1 Tax=Caldinitratiruptor microaerophilus TaxID=671077 RepID=A0AA35CMM0_9FIRM|nr:M23 family metallopeptidase [Caldinitratiruptor microaerophilus]BDG61178.1 hypothetical protein caldi_22680 [Caldinitratiruptor microaerophilus]